MKDIKKLISFVIFASNCLIYSLIIALTRCVQYVAHFDTEGTLFPYQTLRFVPMPCHVIFILIGICTYLFYKKV